MNKEDSEHTSDTDGASISGTASSCDPPTPSRAPPGDHTAYTSTLSHESNPTSPIITDTPWNVGTIADAVEVRHLCMDLHV